MPVNLYPINLYKTMNYVQDQCNPLETDNYYDKVHIIKFSWPTHYQYPINISPRIYRNTRVDDSEFPEHLEDMFPQYYMHSSICNRVKYSTTQ